MPAGDGRLALQSEPVENWNRAYTEAPEILDAFCRAEDPDGILSRGVLMHARPAGRTVLEIGCGTGRYSREWAPSSRRYLGLDRNAGVLALARRCCAALSPRPDWLLADATHIPLADRSVDCVLAGWVVVNLPAASRARVLAEADRVLRREAGSGIWLVENHWSGEFQRLRGKRAEAERVRIQTLVDRHGFSPVELVRTEIRFPSADEAARVLGWLLGDPARSNLRQRPLSRLTHHVMILRRASPR